MKTSLKFCLTFVLAATVLSGQARATIIASDTFTGTGVPLNGRPTETGSLTWAAASTGAPYLELLNNGVQNNVNGGSDITYADVPFNPAPYASYAVSLQVNPDAGAGWIAVGFRSLTGNFLNTPGLWVLLKTGGDFQFFQFFTSSSATVLTNGTVAANSGYNDIRLAYNVSSTFVTLTINNNTLYDHAVTGLVPADFARAGFQFEDESTGRVDNFQLEAVPEPATLGLLLLGAALVRCCGGKRRM